MRKYLLAAVLAALAAIPCAAGSYSEAELKKMFQQSVDTDDLRLRASLRSKIAKASPDSACGLVSQAYLLDQAGAITPKQKMDLYTRAIALDHGLAVAYYNRAHIYSQSGQKEKALEGYKQAIAAGFRKPDAYVGLADAYMHAGNTGLAVENYSKALSMAPGHAFAHNNRGSMYLKLGEYDKAIADFDAALKTSTFAMAHMNRGDAYTGKKMYLKALEDYRAAVDLIPDSPDPYLRRGIMYLTAKDYVKARNNLDKSLELDPQKASAWLYLGIALYQTEKYDDALAAYTRSLNLNIGNTDPYLQMADVYVTQGRHQLAADKLSYGLSLAPGRAALRQKRARVYTALGMDKEAAADYAELFKSAPSAELHYERGDFHLCAGRYKSAEADLLRSKKKDPRSAGVLVDLALVYIRTGRKTEGLKLFSYVTRKSPATTDSYRKLLATGLKRSNYYGENKIKLLREMLALYDGAMNGGTE